MDLTLDVELRVFEKRNKPPHFFSPLECPREGVPEFPTVRHAEFWENGEAVLLPGVVYLGESEEEIAEGSVVRDVVAPVELRMIGLTVAGVVRDGKVRLAMWCVHPVRVRVGMRIAEAVVSTPPPWEPEPVDDPADGQPAPPAKKPRKGKGGANG